MLNRKSLVFVALGALALAACDRTKNEEPNANNGPTYNNPELRNPPAGVATSMTQTTSASADPLAGASNAAQVKRLPEEVKISPTQSSLVNGPVTVRSAPLGDKLTTLTPGQVTQIAAAHDYFLVTFKDGASPNGVLAGWIHKDAFNAPTTKSPASAIALSCAANEKELQTDHEFCAVTCQNDGECSAVNGVCDGFAAGKGATATQPLRYCVHP